MRPTISLNNSQAENGNYKEPLPNLPTSNKEIHQIFSPINFRKKKNAHNSRESAPRKNIIGIDGIMTSTAKAESRNI